MDVGCGDGSKLKNLSEKTLKNFESDFDTTVEPYLGSVVEYLRSLRMKILEKNSFWEREKGNAKVIQKIFRYFSKNWGPHLFVVDQK